MSKFEDNNLIMTRNNLLNEMNLLSYEEFNYIPDINSWSIAQVCNHLAITEETVAKAIAYGLKKSSVSYVPKNIENILDRSFKIEAPEVVKPHIESIEVYQITDQLSHSRNLLMSILDAVEDTAILAEKSVKHPVFGDLPLNQWVELISLHEQRHLAQIEEIRSQYKESIL
jgi:hypothetical protein